MLPPGVYYRGEKLHPQCYRIRRKKDVTTEHIAPRLERIGELVDELLTDTD